MRQGERSSVRVEGKEMVVRLKGGLIDREVLSRLLDRLGLGSIRKRSRLTKAQAVEAAQEVDRGRWESIKHKLVEG